MPSVSKAPPATMPRELVKAEEGREIGKLPEHTKLKKKGKFKHRFGDSHYYQRSKGDNQ